MNTSCSFLQTEKKANWYHFDLRGGSRACYSCGTYVKQVPCEARKLVQIGYWSDYAEVFHIGKHTCTLQPELVSDIEYTTKRVQRFPGIVYKELNNQPDFVMKSSSKILKVPLQMIQDGEENPLQQEDTIFDGCHSRCTRFISLGLLVQHPSMRCVIRLASMEARSDATEDIAIFFKLINEMLQIVGKKEEEYKFNPRFILCDEAGGNIRGIKEALGLEFAATRVVTCQWHFMNKINE